MREAPTERTGEELIAYMRSDLFKDRAERLKARQLAGEHFDILSMAAMLDIPSVFLIANHIEMMAKHGLFLKSTGAVN